MIPLRLREEKPVAINVINESGYDGEQRIGPGKVMQANTPKQCGLHSRSDETIRHVCTKSKGSPLPDAIPVTLNFHPDALHQGPLMIDVLAREGIYRSQFETGTSNGGLTAPSGGDRWLWESRMFGTAYDNGEQELQPKYGALNYLRRMGRADPQSLKRAWHCVATFDNPVAK
jgi:Protein of unknown function (DUF3626)